MESKMESKKVNDNSIVVFLYDLNKIKLLEDEYIINYQYYDGDYAWIMIINSEVIKEIEDKLKKKIINSKLTDKENRLIRLTRKRNEKHAIEFGYNTNNFSILLEDFLSNKQLDILEYMKQRNFIDEKHISLYPVKDIKIIPEEDESLLLDLENTNVKCLLGDCSEKLNLVRNKSIQTVCIDPPYNIGKDVWDNIENYNDWLTSIIIKLEGKLKDNGSMFIFHNDMEAISELMLSIKQNTKLKFIQMITWNKRYEGSKKKGFLDGYVMKKSAHKFELMAEYILFYTFDNTYKYKEARINKKVCSKDIQKEIPSRTGGLTGWYGNIETGLNYPTRERMEAITKHTGLKYEDVVPKFYNQRSHHSVWNYDSAKKNKKCSHLTPKPIDLLENIIKHTTDEGDILLDCFAGTGSLGIACLNTNRKCIMIEKEEEYYNFINDEILANS